MSYGSNVGRKGHNFDWKSIVFFFFISGMTRFEVNWFCVYYSLWLVELTINGWCYRQSTVLSSGIFKIRVKWSSFNWQQNKDRCMLVSCRGCSVLGKFRTVFIKGKGHGQWRKWPLNVGSGNEYYKFSIYLCSAYNQEGVKVIV